MKLTIDTDNLVKLTKNGSQIILEPTAEEAIIKLLEVQHKVESALEELKEQIAEEGIKYDPNFKSVESDNLRIWYRFYGSKYSIDAGRIGELPKHLYSEKKRYYPNAGEVDKYVEEHGELPLAIIERERSKKLSIDVKAGLDD